MCILCGGNIEEGATTPADGVAFDCVTHGAYTVSRSALPRFLKLDHGAQLIALERAKIFAPQRNQEILVTSLDL